mmetsp:Transcript_63440/g.143098  ORF Transcript_63440/g.143098 Transcript_63440/m.143098 type:complete len:496 (+) Transcript_63440:114-1601(+)
MKPLAGGTLCALVVSLYWRAGGALLPTAARSHAPRLGLKPHPPLRALAASLAPHFWAEAAPEAGRVRDARKGGESGGAGVGASLAAESGGRRRFLLGTLGGAVGAAGLTLVEPLPASAASAAASASAASGPGQAVRPAAATAAPLTILQEAISGSLGGAAVSSTKTLVKHPLDTLTVRIQVAKAGKGAGGAKGAMPRREVLLQGLWRGVGPPLVFGVPAGATFFGVKDVAKSALRARFGLDKRSATLLAVLVAQFPYWLIRNPSEVLKTRAQAEAVLEGGPNDGGAPREGGRGADEKEEEKGARVGLGAFRAELRELLEAEGGVRALYRGYGENVACAYPADALKFVLYDLLTGGRGKAKVPPLEGAVLGACATAVSQALTTPLDVVRNRAMLDRTNPNRKVSRQDDKQAPRGQPPKGLPTSAQAATEQGGAGFLEVYLGTLAGIGREEGLGALYAGTVPRIGKAVISGFVQFGAYEATQGAVADFFYARDKGQA